MNHVITNIHSSIDLYEDKAKKEYNVYTCLCKEVMVSDVDLKAHFNTDDVQSFVDVYVEWSNDEGYDVEDIAYVAASDEDILAHEEYLLSKMQLKLDQHHRALCSKRADECDECIEQEELSNDISYKLDVIERLKYYIKHPEGNYEEAEQDAIDQFFAEQSLERDY